MSYGERIYIAAFSAGAMIACVLLCGCEARKTEQAPQKKTPLVRVETVKTEKIARVLDLTGTIEPDRIARLASPAEGPVAYVHVREGDEVKAGRTLLAIGRKTGVNALIASLHEEVKKEEDNLRRVNQLVEKEALPKEQLDMAKAGYERVKAQLAKAEESSGDYSITAPWPGVVSKIFVKQGDFVAPRTPLVEVYAPATLIMLAEVPEKSSAGLQKNMPAEILLDAYPGKTLPAKIVRLYPYLHERLRTRTIELEIGERITLLPGMFGRIRLILEEVREALTVPVNAVVVTPKGAQVAFTVSGGKASMRPVRSGIEANGRIQIMTGLEAGDSIVVAGNEKLKDGAEIRIAGAGPGGGGAPGAGKQEKSGTEKKKEGGR